MTRSLSRWLPRRWVLALPPRQLGLDRLAGRVIGTALLAGSLFLALRPAGSAHSERVAVDGGTSPPARAVFAASSR